MALLLMTAAGLGLLTSAPRFAVHTPRAARAAHVLLCADAADMSELRVREAAIRVVAAASQFGDAQRAAAVEWVKEAMDSRSGVVDGKELLDKQMALFEECLLEESFKCKELDQALTALEVQLKQGKAGPVDAFVGLFGQSKIDRSCARVLKAAAKFGAEQERIAELWLAEVRGCSDTMYPLALLEQQALLFGECLLDYDEEGESSSRCKELDDALGALQLSLGVRGMIVSTKHTDDALTTTNE